VTGLRAGGGKAACWRVAGAIAAGAAVATGAIGLVATATLAAGAAFLAAEPGTTLRAIGRGFGNGTFGLAQASAAHPDNPSASARLVARAVDRRAAARADGVTAFLRGESCNGGRPSSI
jgi:hypothetical protein